MLAMMNPAAFTPAAPAGAVLGRATKKDWVPAGTAWFRLLSDLVPAKHQGGSDWFRLNPWTLYPPVRLVLLKHLD